MRTVLRTTLALPVLGLLATADLDAQALEIQEWPVPWEQSRPRDPDVDAQGRVWFVGQAGNYIAYFAPRTEEFKQYAIEEGTHPHNLIVDADGMVWYAGNRNARIGRLDPNTGDVQTYMMPDPAARDPHTLTFDPRGDIWFTTQQGNFVGKLTVATGEVKLVPVPVERSRPYGIKVAEDGRPWVVLFGTNKLATLDPATLELETVDLPRDEARPRRLELTSDGLVWYVDHDGGFLGRYNPETGEFKEWPSPSGSRARPYATTLDDRERIWYVETGVQPNQFVGFDTKSESFLESTPVPSGGGAVRHMMFHAPTGEIWFGTDTNNIARARVSPE